MPGLRREEVAQLAGVSVDYYVRLERGRHLNVSESVLDAIARALRLNELERAHLFTVARPTRARPRPLPPQRVRPGLHRCWTRLTDVPALVSAAAWTSWPPTASPAPCTPTSTRCRTAAQHGPLDLPRRGRPELYVDWEARPAAPSPPSTCTRDATRTTPRWPSSSANSPPGPDFRRWWADHDVFRRTHGTKRFHHPVVGDLILGYEAFTPTDDPEQLLGVYTAEPGSPSEQRLRLLAGWTSDRCPRPSRTPRRPLDRPG